MITLIKSGLLTSVQDLGRHGFQKYGVIASGAMDQTALRIANILVGNGENEPALEITLLGPVLRFEEDCLISICGGDLSPSIDGYAVGTWRTVLIKKGSQLVFGQAAAGTRAYLAIAGGISVEKVMNSKSTYLRAGIGGYQGRALQPGDIVQTGAPSELSKTMMEDLKAQTRNLPFVQMGWSVSSSIIQNEKKGRPIRVMKGKQYHLFDEESKRKLFSERFEVSPQSDRMGYRLKGPELRLKVPSELISEAVSFGSIQVPPEGNPIILLADRQTTGGYPKIGQIASVDLPLISQAKPGDWISFKEVSHEEAQLLFLEKEESIRQLKMGIAFKFK